MRVTPWLALALAATVLGGCNDPTPAPVHFPTNQVPPPDHPPPPPNLDPEPTGTVQA